MRAIKIDAKEQTITEIDITEPYPEINHAIGADTIEIGMTLGREFQGGSDDHLLYCDEEGMIKWDEGKFTEGFLWAGELFAGSGVVIGWDPCSGEEIDATLTIEDVGKIVQFTEMGKMKEVA